MDTTGLLIDGIELLHLAYFLIHDLFIVLCILLEFIGFEETCSHYTGGLSVLIPCFHEELTLKKTIESVVKCKRDFDIEIIIMDDGVTSSAKDYLMSQYDFKDCGEKHLRNVLSTKPVRSMEATMIQDIPFYLVDKDNGRKADALNTRIHIAHYDYFLCLDGDSLVGKNALVGLQLM